MVTLNIDTPRAFAPLLRPARYKGAYGGRGSGKSHFFAEHLIESAMLKQGFRAVCIREVQKSLKESAKRLIEDKIDVLGLGREFNPLADRIETPGGGVILFQGMQDHTAESIKSLEGMDVAWVEEAQTLSERSLELLRPTIRGEGSELWFSWNPRRKTDPVDALLRSGKLGNSAVVVQANWRDNPCFPDVLKEERLFDLENNPERYDHIWEGGYASAFKGAYYAAALTKAKLEGRIGHVSADPLLSLRAYCDIGGSGGKADAFTIWICQFVNREIRVLHYYESVGQTLDYHVRWMRDNGYESAKVFLPHDGARSDSRSGKTYAEHWREAGFDVQVIPNQGKGAAMIRVEAARRLFPQIWFNERTTEAGRDALGFYHERRDDARGIGLGPEHDWSSHGADAFGLMCVHYEPPNSSDDLSGLYSRRGAGRAGGYLAA